MRNSLKEDVARSGGCARRCTSTWRIAGFVHWASTARCRIIRRSRRTGMAASATATCCAGCLRPCCSAASTRGLVGGEGFAVDASLIHADAGDRTRVEGSAGLPSGSAGRAVEEYLAVLDDAAFGAAYRPPSATSRWANTRPRVRASAANSVVPTTPRMPYSRRTAGSNRCGMAGTPRVRYPHKS